MAELTKRNKAYYYKHRLERAVDLLKKVRYLEAETPMELEDSLEEIKWSIDYLFDDLDFLLEEIHEDV